MDNIVPKKIGMIVKEDGILIIKLVWFEWREYQLTKNPCIQVVEIEYKKLELISTFKAVNSDTDGIFWNPN